MNSPKTKIIPLKILSFILGISALYFFSENSLIYGGVLLLSAIAIESIVSVFYSRIFCFFIFPAVLTGANIFLFQGSVFSGIFLFLGIFLTSKFFANLSQEKIHFTVFSNAVQSFKKGMLFIALGIFLLVNPFSSSTNITEKVQEIAKPIIEKLLNEQFSPEKTQGFYAQCKNFPQKELCIKKIDDQIAKEKEKASTQLETELTKTVEKWTSPESLQKTLAEKNISLPENFDINALQEILILIFFILFFLPFSFLFALAGAVIQAIIFWILKISRIFTIETQEIEQEILR